MNHATRTLSAALAVLTIGLAACGSGDDDDAAAAATTTQPTTTAAPATTDTQAPTTTATCEDGDERGTYSRHVVCEDGEWRADPQTRTPTPGPQVAVPPSTTTPPTTAAPTTTQPPQADALAWTPPAEEGVGVFSANDTVSRVPSVVYVDLSRFPTGPYATSCQRYIGIIAKDWAEKPTTCLIVFWTFDVGANAPVGASGSAAKVCLTPQSVVAFNHEVGGGLTSCALPGTIENTMTYTYAGGTPGMTLPFDVGSYEARQSFVLQVPDESQFLAAKAS